MRVAQLRHGPSPGSICKCEPAAMHLPCASKHRGHYRNMALTDQHLRTAASMVRDRYGNNATAHIAGRIAALEKAGDMEGADTWAVIMERLGEIES